jgi:hypothetical protein
MAAIKSDLELMGRILIIAPAVRAISKVVIRRPPPPASI